MSKLKLLLLALCVAMIAVTVATSLKQNIADVLPRMIRDPWTIATFIDYYFNIILISLWMVYKENSPWRALAWFGSFVMLGSIATSFYAFVQVCKLKPGDAPEKILVR